MDAPSCEGCRRLQAELDKTRAELEQTRAELAELRQQLRELRARLKLDSTNSSLPPSANPLHGRKLTKKKKSKRKRGGQTGHAALPEPVRHVLTTSTSLACTSSLRKSMGVVFPAAPDNVLTRVG